MLPGKGISIIFINYLGFKRNRLSWNNSFIGVFACKQSEYIMKCECYDKENVNEHKILSRYYGIVLLSAKTFYVLQWFYKASISVLCWYYYCSLSISVALHWEI